MLHFPGIVLFILTLCFDVSPWCIFIDNLYHVLILIYDLIIEMIADLYILLIRFIL